MLVPDLQLVKLRLVVPEIRSIDVNLLLQLLSNLIPRLVEVLLFKDFLEEVFEASVVGLEDGVLGAHVQRPLLLDGVLEAAVSKSTDGLRTDRVKSRNQVTEYDIKIKGVKV